MTSDALLRRRRYVQSVTDLDNGKLLCHAFRHAWDPSPISHDSPVGLEVWVIKLRCPSCGKVRTDYVEPGTYALVYRHYTTVDGFSVVDPADLTDYREEVVRRFSNGQATSIGRFGRGRP